MKSRTRLSRSCSIRGRDAVKLIPDRVERRDGNENTERERERWRAYIHAIRFRNARARDRCPRSKVHGCARALSSPAESHLPHTFSFVAGGLRASLSVEREREGGRGARADSRKKDSLSRKYERGLFVSSPSYENVSA